ncbi:PLDc_N domain-containing protein [Defluviicoccus vanus]|uniref:PLDc_N domain-containing protein n=2 Tax=Defluviicoccus vanus TaxID=111831 RepID=A0A7H1N653_9PROT|nr:PLDc_N domain-containing protein [Defluviicoccus vanus]
MGYSLFGLVVLAIDIWGIVNVLRSGASTGAKALWVLLIIFLPLVGLILWFLTGPRSARAVA